MSRLLLAAVSLVMFASQALAAEPALRVLTPPDPGAPTPVLVDVADLRVFSIREEDEIFELGGRLSMQWVDPRQAFDPAAVGADTLEYQGKAAEDKLDDLWWPAVEFVDSVGSRDRMAVGLTLRSDGSVWYRERFFAEIKQDFYLGDFPYDEHFISFAVEPFAYDGTAVEFVAAESGTAQTSWEPTEWLVEDPVLEVGTTVGHVCLAADGAADGPFTGGCDGEEACAEGESCQEIAGFPRMTISMEIARVASHYNGNIILPLVLIVLIATAVFWMDLERTNVAERLALSFTSLLTVVAFDFVTSGSLPKLWYSTVLDRVVTASYVFLAINIALCILVDRVAAAGRTSDRGHRLDRWLRWAFPIAYLGCMAILILRAG